MSKNKFLFKENEYTLSELITLRGISPLYKEGEVVDLQTGECLKIEDIDNWRSIYISDLISDNHKRHIMKNYDSKNKLKIYEEKFLNGTISKEELFELIKSKRSKYFEIEYNDYFISNCSKEKPKGISHSEYGRFFVMLDFLSYSNTITHKNGQSVKEVDLIKKLDISSIKTFRNFMSKLSKFGLLAKNKTGGKNFIHINPAYAKRRIKIDFTTYTLFKSDLKEYLNEYEIAYFEMENQSNDEYISSTIEII